MKTTASTRFSTTISAAALLAALLVAPGAMAQSDTSGMTTGAIGDYGQMDADASGGVSASEFQPYIDQTYDAWDTNQDDLLGEEEFFSGLFGTWDEDRDTILIQEEYDRGYASWFNDIDLEEDTGYSTTLGGTDEGLSQRDFVAGASETGLYEAWTGSEGDTSREDFSARWYDLISGGDDELTQSEFEEFYRGG
ncbi:hypothetical protein [Salinarimonas ramus]|uniref:EF-hand domain-containing protein n=1 Tax=Salinarimonas ramus TaxID=690164 RepID=A0A917QG74_9HYPH|nr:hypothetical protein [Salinarimonas ramus]GGK48345.1 hypothetical protein GCM10011322_39160 [Salinarimonas ramus]